MPKKVLINPASSHQNKPTISTGVLVEGTLYISGQIARNKDGRIVDIGDMAAQARQAFSNIERVLGEVEASFEDVVKITCYISDMRYYADYSKVRSEIFPNADIASATVVSPGFVDPDALIEIEAIAVLNRN